MPIFDNLSIQTTLRSGERGRFPVAMLSEDSSRVFRDWLRIALKTAGITQREAGAKVVAVKTLTLPQRDDQRKTDGKARYVERTIAMHQIPIPRALAIANWMRQYPVFSETAAAKEAHKFAEMIDYLDGGYKENARQADGDIALPILMPEEAIVALARAQKAYFASKGADFLSRNILAKFWTRETAKDDSPGMPPRTYRDECSSTFASYVAALAKAQTADIDVSNNAGDVTTVNAALAATAVCFFLRPRERRTPARIAIAPAVLGGAEHFLRAYRELSKRVYRHSIRR